MPIAATEKAKMVARLGVMRLGASRLDYYQPIFHILVNGVDHSTDSTVRIAGISISDLLDGTPNTATMRVSGFVPVKGHEVKMALGYLDASHFIFCGHILTVRQVFDGDVLDNQAYDLNCISYEWLLNRRQVTKRYTNMAADLIAADIVATFTTGFTIQHIVGGLATISEITFTNEDVTTCLDRLAKRIGGYWYVDYTKDTHFFLTETRTAGSIVDGSYRSASRLAVATDLSQVRTRTYCEGGGSTALIERAPGDITIPVVDDVWYNASGGTIVSGPQRITYTSKSALAGTGTTAAGKPLLPTAPSVSVPSGTSGNLSTGDRTYKSAFVTPAGDSEVSSASGTATIGGVSAPGAPTAAVSSGVDGNLTGFPVISSGDRTYKTTYVTLAGETTAGSASGTTTIQQISSPAFYGSASGSGTTGGSMALGGYYYAMSFVTLRGETQGWPEFSVTLSGGNNAVSITSIPTSTDGRVTKRRIYRGIVGQVWPKFLVTTINDNSTTTYTDTTADASLGTAQSLDYDNGTAYGKVALTSIPTSGDGRVTKRKIYRTTGGGSVYKLLTTINDNSTTTYTDNTADESLGADEPATNTSGSGQVNLTSIPVGPTGTTARKLYRTEASGSVYKFLATISGNVTTTYTDNTADSSLGETAPTESHVGGTAGDTTLRVANTATVDVSGGWVQVGSQILRFTGRTTSSGEGDLTGIPATGTGSMAAAISFGSAVINAPFLSGIPPTGIGAIVYSIAAGDDINLLVSVTDGPAVANMSGFVGGDGIHEDYLQDRRLSETEATAHATAQNTLTKDPLVTVSYTTRDQTTKSGRTVTFNLSGIVTGTYKIQSVQISGFDGNGQFFPTRQVEASARRFTFESLLNLIRAS